MSEAELEAAMAASHEDAYLVYADLLIQRGDPRGDLIHVHHKLLANPDDAQLLAAEKALLANPDLVGPFASAKWRLGFVESATIDDAAALDHPSLRFVRTLKISTPRLQMSPVLSHLTSRAWPSIRTLEIRQANMRTAQELDGTYETLAADALMSIPDLITLHVDGWDLFQSLAHDQLRELSIHGQPMRDPRWDLPRVESLTWELLCDDTGTGVDWYAEAIEPVWLAALPSLQHLDLSCCSSVGFMSFSDFPPDDVENPDWCGMTLHYAAPNFLERAAQLRTLQLPGSAHMTREAVARWIADGPHL